MSKIDKAVTAFRANVQAEYELEAEVVDRLCEFFKTNASGLAKAEKADKPEKADKADKPTEKGTTKTAEKKTVKPDVPKTVRKKSAYNVYVREMMKTPDVSALNHRDKMSAIATLWKAMSEADKAKYTQLAAECNDTESQATTAVPV
jgi:hypothetical protein